MNNVITSDTITGDRMKYRRPEHLRRQVLLLATSELAATSVITGSILINSDDFFAGDVSPLLPVPATLIFFSGDFFHPYYPFLL